MKKWILLLTFFLSPSFGSLSLAAPAANKAVITYAGLSEKDSALFVAQDRGFFRKYDLDIKLVHVRTGAVAISALIAGESQFHTGSATGATFGAMAGGLDAVFIAGLINKLTGTVVTAPAIKSPSELKGKNIGVQSIGGGIWMFTMLAFDYWGLDPKRDNIKLRVIGDDSLLAQAVATGTVDGSYLGYTFASLLERQGFRILADLAKLRIPYQGHGVMARRSFVNSSPDLVEKVLRAMAESVGFILQPANKNAVMTTLAKRLRLPRVEDAAESYENVLSLYDRRIFPNVEGLQNVIRLLGTANEKIRRLKVEDVVDDRIVKKLEKEGVF